LYNKENNQLTLDFISHIKKLSKNKPVMLSFESTEVITAAALLLLYSTLDLLKQSEKHKNVRINTSSVKGTNKVALARSGIIDLTLNRSSNVDIQSQTLPVIKGTAMGEEFEQVIDHVKFQVFDNKWSAEEENTFGAAVSETVGNVKLHAFPFETEEKPWWVLCKVIEDDLFLAIYDSGVGIPSTILQTTWIKKVVENTPRLTKMVLNKTDADLILLSMQLGQTSTKEKKHGKGSKSINALVDENPNGTLWVFSNSGVYCKSNGEIETQNFNNSINGTLVQWNIKLK
jgi:hypothetical protein